MRENSYPIGWCRIKLFHYDEAGVTGWKLMTGDCVYRLVPGAAPENVASEDINVTSGMYRVCSLVHTESLRLRLTSATWIQTL